MAQKYSILRLLDGGSTAGLSFGSGTKLSGPLRHNGPDTAPPDARLDIEELSFSDVRQLMRDPDVMALAPSMPTRLVAPFEAPPTKPSRVCWGVEAVGATSSAFDGRGTVMAILDTGIDDRHVAFRGVSFEQSDFTGAGNGDKHGHGTHCAGIMFGRDVDDVRIGVARGVSRALVGKVLDNNGYGQSDWLFQGIQWASGLGADVITMAVVLDFTGMVADKIGEGWPSELAAAACLDAYRRNLDMLDVLMDIARARAAPSGGALVIAAGGNDSERGLDPRFELPATLPGVLDNVLSVGALVQREGAFRVAEFSNTLVDLCAPGVSLLSAKAGGGLATLSGTSMALSHVAGVAALWWQALRAIVVPPTSAAVIEKLRSAARTNVFHTGTDVASRGAGLVTAPIK